MARFGRLEVLGTMLETGLVPVFYHPEIEVAENIVRACADGGARLVEFTSRGDFAIDVFTRLEQYCRENLPQTILGVGSVSDAPTAAMYLARGANFVVGPVLDVETVKLCNRRKVACSPGCGSATEIARAEELGCEIVKVFPGGQVGGPAFIKAILGPSPWSSLMPTGGVDCTRESLAAWFHAGVACVGIGSQLVSKDLVESSNFTELADRVRETLAIIQELKANNG